MKLILNHVAFINHDKKKQLIIIIPMKIICVGRNYVAHAKELNNEVPSKPVIFLKPDTSVLKNNADFYFPPFSKEIHHEVELIVRICKEGKYIAEKFAGNYFDKIGLGIDFTARDIQQQHKEKGLPWELAKAFDHAAPISELVDKAEFPKLDDLHFHLEKNGKQVQVGHTALMIFSIEQLIAFVSQYITLRKGDILFTGTPTGVGPIHIGDRLTGFLEGKKLLDFHIK